MSATSFRTPWLQELRDNVEAALQTEIDLALRVAVLRAAGHSNAEIQVMTGHDQNRIKLAEHLVRQAAERTRTPTADRAQEA